MKLRLRHSANTKCCLPQRSLPDVNPSRSHVPPRDLVERTDRQLEEWLVGELVLRAEECDQVRTRKGTAGSSYGAMLNRELARTVGGGNQRSWGFAPA